jgi:hypothetical protein
MKKEGEDWATIIYEVIDVSQVIRPIHPFMDDKRKLSTESPTAVA